LLLDGPSSLLLTDAMPSLTHFFLFILLDGFLHFLLLRVGSAVVVDRDPFAELCVDILLNPGNQKPVRCLERDVGATYQAPSFGFRTHEEHE
jgi:hypothetical protein